LLFLKFGFLQEEAIGHSAQTNHDFIMGKLVLSSTTAANVANKEATNVSSQNGCSVKNHARWLVLERLAYR
jgi:hypothetical protein